MMLSVFDAALEVPARPAVLFGERVVTFRELSERVARRIAWLGERGIPTDDDKTVALVGNTDLETLELVMALLEVGQPIAMIHPRLTPGERQAVIDTVGPALVIEHALPIEQHGRPSVARRREIDVERCLAILFTSGTTGRPKGISLSRRAFIASARASETNLGFLDDDRWLLGLPIAHVGGLSILTRGLLARRTVVVPGEIAEGRRLTAAALIRAIEEQRATIVSLVPTQLEWLLADDIGWSSPPHLRVVLLGGAAARPALLERAAKKNIPVLTTYGLTEACSQVTTQPLGTINRGELGAGRPISGVEVRIVNGAIQVRGPTLLSGYVPEASSPALDAEGWLHTDDLGRFDDEGNLHVLGRRSDLIITGGENVFPAEVEAALERCPGIAAACVFPVPDETWGELVAAALVPGAGGPPSNEVLGRFVRERLARHRRPRRVAWVEAFATTPAGKLDRRETARLAASRLAGID